MVKLNDLYGDDPTDFQLDEVQAAADFYVGVLDAVSQALRDCRVPQLPPEMFVKALAQRGYTIDMPKVE